MSVSQLDSDLTNLSAIASLHVALTALPPCLVPVLPSVLLSAWVFLSINLAVPALNYAESHTPY